jgi:beta-lactamase regulating signal transducer with metallopeptidase domain
VIEWVVTSCILIAIVVALRSILKGKISLRLQYALWGIVLLRLLIPFSVGSSGLSVMNAVEKAALVQNAEIISSVDAIEHTADGSVEGYHPSDVWHEFPIVVAERATAEEYTRMGKMLAFRKVFTPVWLCGAAILMVLFAVSNGRFASRLRRTRKQVEAKTSPIPVYVSGVTETPCLFGLFSPAIYVTPEAAQDATMLRHTVEHETTHFRHGDHLWAIMRGMCLALHWYNPLVWWAAFVSRNDSELACDEATIDRIGENERAEYGRTLISMTCQKRTALLITATTMTGSKGSVKERITLIAKRPRMAMYALMAVLLAAAVAVGCTFTGANGRAESPTDGWFSNEAWPLAESYAEANGLTISEVNAVVFRYADGVSADVAFTEDEGNRSVNVSFSLSDGRWALIPVNAVNLLDPGRWTTGVDISVELENRLR